MLLKLARYCRPVATRTCRNFGSWRNVPVNQMCERRARHFDDVFSSHSSKKNWVHELGREVEGMIGRMARNSVSNTGRSSGGVQVIYNRNCFEVKLDVQNFKPEELEIKLTDNRLLINGKHEQNTNDHGFVKQEFQREFVVPEDVNLDSINSTMSEEGVLTIRANVQSVERPPDKVIEIKREGSTKEGDVS